MSLCPCGFVGYGLFLVAFGFYVFYGRKKTRLGLGFAVSFWSDLRDKKFFSLRDNALRPICFVHHSFFCFD
jgi:hypothetical protein